MKFIFPLFLAIIFCGCATAPKIQRKPCLPSEVQFLKVAPDGSEFVSDFFFCLDELNNPEAKRIAGIKAAAVGANVFVLDEILSKSRLNQSFAGHFRKSDKIGEQFIYSGKAYFFSPK